MTASARYTYLPGSSGISDLLDQVNSFCLKYPEYRLMQLIPLPMRGNFMYAVLTTDS